MRLGKCEGLKLDVESFERARLAKRVLKVKKRETRVCDLLGATED